MKSFHSQLITDLCAREEWDWPNLVNLKFANIGVQDAEWLEKKFEEEEVNSAIF